MAGSAGMPSRHKTLAGSRTLAGVQALFNYLQCLQSSGKKPAMSKGPSTKGFYSLFFRSCAHNIHRIFGVRWIIGEFSGNNRQPFYGPVVLPV